MSEHSSHSDRAPAPRPSGPSFFFPLLLIAAGIVLLLYTMGMLPSFAWWRLWVLWPAILILIGLDVLLRRAPALLRLLAALVAVALLVGAAYLVVRPGQESARPVQTTVARGDMRTGSVKIDLAAGQLSVEPLGDSPNWAEVDLAGPAQEPRVTRLDSTAALEIVQGGWSSGWQESRWSVRLHPSVPAAVKVHVAVGKCVLNLTRLDVTALEVDTGVADCTVLLPAGGDVGAIPVEIDGGVGALHVVVPEGMAAQIHLDPGLGGVRVDTARFLKVNENLYRSADYEGASYRLDVDVNIGVGSIEVK